MQNAYAMVQRWLCHICRAKEAVIQAGRYIETAAGLRRLRPALQGLGFSL
jgi:hypothetical protein